MSGLTYDDIVGVILEFAPDISISQGTAIVTSLLEIQTKNNESNSHADTYAQFLVSGATQAAHEFLVTQYREYPPAVEALYSGFWIQAIKEVRSLTHCTLKAAKDAIDEVRR